MLLFVESNRVAIYNERKSERSRLMDNIKDVFFESEPPFTAEEIAKGILFLMNEYYIGNFKKTGSSIELDFGNGQKFVVEVREI